MALISKTDFQKYTQLSENMPDRLFNFHYENFLQFIFPKVDNEDLRNELINYSNINYHVWNESKIYDEGNEVIWEGFIRKSKTNNNEGNSPLNATYWELTDIGYFWKKYLVSWACFEIYISILTEHGINFTQFSLVTPIDTTSQPISGSDRARMIDTYRGKANVSWLNLINYLDSINYTLNGIQYKFECNKNMFDFTIRALKSGKRRTERGGSNLWETY
jgi:hypothetical protein